MPETTTTGTETTTTTTTQAATPWYQGKVDGETVGHWQNKGWKIDDAATIAIEATKAHREAERLIGAPPSQLIRLPQDPIKDADQMKQVWQRLGAPQDAKDYDFPVLKDKDGKVTNTALDSELRTSLFKVNAPKPVGEAVAAAVAKYLNDTATAAAAEKAATLATERETLAKNWGNNAPANKVVAQAAAKALGMQPAEIDALEATIGYARTMEMLRQVGARIGEDKFIASGDGPGVMSSDAAKAKIAELKTDKAWVTRYTGGDKAAFTEMQNLLKVAFPERK
jgi:hypothetical protein